MNAALSPDATRLRAIRAALAAIEPAVWTRVHGADGAFVESRGEMGELFVLANFDEATVDEIDFICNAADTVTFLLRLLDAAYFRIRQLRGLPEPHQNDHAADMATERKLKKYASECAMRCKDPEFKQFLHEQHGLEKPLTDERVAQKVRSILGVQSRKELNNGGQASEAWKALRGAFDAWRKAGR
ncbi:hypothetical protein [Mesorhizobium sp.]|uniref:hypothetical protein n=1 Tax=Mesorhizobium sp. TaxID=1871066 RepID=UPI000FE2AC26|nr:hypothetical protein [Mesorhizobium sp.]RWQ12359.1 MAG: hypothetical protein EOR91_01195 [Mesorhizobium sp.]